GQRAHLRAPAGGRDRRLPETARRVDQQRSVRGAAGEQDQGGRRRLRLPAPPRSAVLDPLPTARPTATTPRIIAIGASTGGPQTLQTILTRLTANYAAPVVVVQHISP